MSDSHKTAFSSIARLENAEHTLASQRGIVGLDGFVDQILRVVDKRSSDGTTTFVPTITEWGKRVQAAGGKSTKFEMSVSQVKLGGNGPIMACALASLGLPLTCVGNLGWPQPHAIFQPMANSCKLVTLADAGYTDAVEFEDGKIMLSRQQACADVHWDALQKAFGGVDGVRKLFDEATFVAITNWAALPHMSDIWARLQSEVCPRLARLPAGPRRLFIDLADPQFCAVADLRHALDLVGAFAKWFDVTLGINQKEAGELLHALGLKAEGDDRAWCRDAARTIRENLGVARVVVHAVAFATVASSTEAPVVEGPFVARPLISTGAGDHFNAGFSLAAILGGTPEDCLQCGVATSGFYVRTAKSPSLGDLRGFLRRIAEGKPD
ncbi:MAG: PfkB family carbohydrate kinase [Verrucomicrobiia bacterium]